MTDNAANTAPEQDGAPTETYCPPGRRPFVVAASVLGSSMAFINGTAVTLALNPIQMDLHAGLGQVLWIINIYTLFLAALILVGGALGDLYGRRGIFVTGVGVFVAASLGCAVAPSAELLILARAGQGIGAALLTPLSLALISAAYPKETRGRAIGAWAAASAVMTAIGPPVGGWLATHGSWRWIFYANIPLGILAIVIALALTPSTPKQPPPERIDWAGAVLAVFALGAVAFALIYAANGQGPGWVWQATLLAGAAGFVALVKVERDAPAPMAAPELFSSRCFSAVNIITFLLYGAFGGLFVFYPIVLKEAYGYGVDQSGLAFLGFALSMSGLSGVAGFVIERIGLRRTLMTGLTIATVGFAMMGLGPFASHILGAAAAMFVFGAGLALVVPALSTAIFNTTPEPRHGAASGVNNAISRAASLFAVAGYGLIAASSFRAHAGPVAGMADYGMGAMIPAVYQDAYRAAMAASFRSLVWVSIGLGLASLFVAAFLLTEETEKGSFRAEFRDRLIGIARLFGSVNPRRRRLDRRLRRDGDER